MVDRTHDGAERSVHIEQMISCGILSHGWVLEAMLACVLMQSWTNSKRSFSIVALIALSVIIGGAAQAQLADKKSKVMPEHADAGAAARPPGRKWSTAPRPASLVEARQRYPKEVEKWLAHRGMGEGLLDFRLKIAKPVQECIGNRLKEKLGALTLGYHWHRMDPNTWELVNVEIRPDDPNAFDRQDTEIIIMCTNSVAAHLKRPAEPGDDKFKDDLYTPMVSAFPTERDLIYGFMPDDS
jgi:hypothetical protein